jgi:hypothetical protein
MSEKEVELLKKEVELLRKINIKLIVLLSKLRKLRDQIRLECNKEQVARAMSEAEYKDSELKRFHDRICGMDDISLN